MGTVSHRLFPFGLAAALCWANAGCAVVGYPAPVHEPPNVTARSYAPPALPEVPVRSVALEAAPLYVTAAVRTYEVFGRTYTTLPTGEGYAETGVASWYGEPFHGRRTASGERFDMYALTAAHRTLPLSTCVVVQRTDDERYVVVRVNDRGPFSGDERRIIDLSYSAAREIGLIAAGSAEVEVRALQVGAAC